MPSSVESKSANATLTAHIRKSFLDGQQFALDVQAIAPPGFTILFGPSGAGKTTLLNCVAGLERPETGHIDIGKRALFDSDRNVDIPVARRNVGYVLQDLALFPHLTVEQNVGYGLARLSHTIRKERVRAMLREFRIEHLAPRLPTQISGGERQRVALARSLVTDPCVLLLDEPLVALDAATKTKILDDLRRWNETLRIPILYVTHSRDEVAVLGERVLVIENGRIIAEGTPHEVLEAPRLETVAQLAGFENIFDAKIESVHEDRGTMVCRLMSDGNQGTVFLETPLVRADAAYRLRVGIRAGDILLAIVKPEGISARNVIPGRIVSIERRDMIISARVDCGVEFYVHLTLAARDALNLTEGREVWLVIKTHSCHLMKK
jgi:molybdate transport system ATP-binding protein